MPAFLSAADFLMPDHFAILLKEIGLLRQGMVTSIKHEPVTGQFGKSHLLYRILIEYEETGFHTPPNCLFLKFGKSSKETFFYKIIAKSMPESPLLQCYFANYDPEADQTCLLLKDLSKSHFQTEWPIPPSADLCFQTIEDLARIHAYWWQNPRLESEFRSAIPPGRCWEDRRALAIKNLPGFIDFLDDRISVERRSIYERLSASSSRTIETRVNSANQTLLHGDMHLWNVFYPLDSSGNICFFDWNMWDIGCPTDDLAYLIAVHWYPERRRRMEQELLAVYHRRLVDAGVANYPFHDFLYDYRVSVARSLLLPVWQWQRGISPGIWWSHLERIFLAFEDLNCQELL